MYLYICKHIYIHLHVYKHIYVHTCACMLTRIMPRAHAIMVCLLLPLLSLSLSLSLSFESLDGWPGNLNGIYSGIPIWGCISILINQLYNFWTQFICREEQLTGRELQFSTLVEWHHAFVGGEGNPGGPLRRGKWSRGPDSPKESELGNDVSVQQC